MSDRILRALMHLFAIVPQWGDGTASDERTADEMVRLFLKQQLSQELVEKYLAVFNEYLLSLRGDATSGRQAKRTSVNSVKVLRICTEINKELNAKQKYVVLLRLIEFIYSSGAASLEQPLEFTKTVAEIFNISQEEYEATLSLANHDLTAIPDSPLFLKIDNRSDSSLKEAKHLFHHSLEGELWVLFLKTAQNFFVRYRGEETLTINGQPLLSNTIHIFSQGSVIRGTKTEAIYYSEAIRCFLEVALQTAISFKTHNLEFRFPNGETGIHNLNFSASSGEMIAIMGGSGAGKSTLLNLLNGNSNPSDGEVLVNGINLHREKKKTEGIIGYIPQDDLLIEDLTVFQNLFYNAKLCYGDMDDAALTKKGNAVLENLGLGERSYMKVGSVLDKTISGGQRKRLNIALELIREPSVLFVDEPTSGLSSRDSENVMDLLKQLSLTGKLVIVVIHQPSSDIFKLFDKLLLLDTGGYPVYYGNPSDSLIYFKRLAEYADADVSECITCGNINPEQIFSILETKVLDEYGQLQNERKISPLEWNLQFQKNLVPASVKGQLENEELKSTFKKPSKWDQFKVFITRDVLSKASNKQYLLINLLEAPVLGFVLSYLIRYQKPGADYAFRDNPNLPAYLFMTVIVSLFLGLTVSAEEIFRDRKILKRESFLNLSRSSYLFSKISVMFLISAIQSFLFVMIGNSIMGVKGMYFDYWLIMFTTSCFANLLGLNISSAFNSAVTIYILVPLLIIPQILLSGVIVKFDKLNPNISSQVKVPILGEVMTSRWAFEALAVNQYKSNEYEKNFFSFDKTMSHASYRTIFWISRMEDKVQSALDGLKNGTKDKVLISSLELIREELKREMASNRSASVEALISQLTPETFSLAIAGQVKDFLDILKKFYIDRYNKTSSEKDGRVLALQASTSDAEKLKQIKRDYTNEALDDLVLNKNDQVQIAETGNRFVQHYQPIYTDGDKGSFLRANFYTSRKNFLGSLIETFWANTMVVWLMTLFLSTALYFEWLKKAVERLGNLKFKS